ncbi:MAG: hypothetical protein BGO78_11115 [Chloroflexi bacterium 44-23]|nr:MAG: hypothetical protein BGO78_11115 [Chloroflexi bacterium 44-23]
MARQFYTEQDIEDIVKRGSSSLELSDDVVLTALAYEKAQKLGLTLIQKNDTPPAAPLRPYLSQSDGSAKAKPAVSAASGGQRADINLQPVRSADLKVRIRQAVLQRLGNKVDPMLLDRVIERVLSSTGLDKG